MERFRHMVNNLPRPVITSANRLSADRTRVLMRIPPARQDETVPPPHAGRRAVPNPPGRPALPCSPLVRATLRILVAEPDPVAAEPLVKGLRRHGHQAEVVHTGDKALIEYQSADLVLLDLELPDVDGLDICRGIRAVSDVPIIAITARATEIDCVLGLQA